MLLMENNMYHLSSVIHVIQGFCSFQNNAKILDLSYKTGLDFRDCFGSLELS